jgi:hypothetical protein
MMKNINILSISVIVVLCISLFFTYKSKEKYKRDSHRWKDNYTQVQNDVSTIELTLEEYKNTNEFRNDSLLKELKIKPRQIEKIVYIENTYALDDTVTPDLIEDNKFGPDVVVGDDNKYKLDFLTSKECLTVGGSIITSDKDVKLDITYMQSVNSFKYVAYWEREKRKVLGIFNTRLFGRKLAKLEIKGICGETKLKEINIIKRR